MSLPSANIVYLATGLKLVRERTSDSPRYSLRGFINNRWVILNRWDDPWRVASLLVLAGYEPDRMSALRMLKALSAC